MWHDAQLTVLSSDSTGSKKRLSPNFSTVGKVIWANENKVSTNTTGTKYKRRFVMAQK
jgi:hypothetical protein